MDVKMTFLNSDLDKEVYMRKPKGFITPGLLLLVKSLDGLKQAPKQWDQKFDEGVLKNGFHINDADKCVYTRLTGDK